MLLYFAILTFSHLFSISGSNEFAYYFEVKARLQQSQILPFS